MISKFNKFNEGISDDKQLNWIIDKISKLGEDSLTPGELDFLNSYKVGKKPKDRTVEHYNKFIVSLLNDVNNKNITEKTAKKFIEKYISKDDLFEFMLTLMKEGKLNFLSLYDDSLKEEKDYRKEDFKVSGFWNEPKNEPKDKPKRKKRELKYIKIPNFTKY